MKLRWMKYRLAEAASVDLDGGRIVCAFNAGDVTPSDEAEAEALEHLVEIGVASRVKAKEEKVGP